jgi:hypothetical protein
VRDLQILLEAMQNGPGFDAISYVWGNKELGSEILVNDCSFKVSKNV